MRRLIRLVAAAAIVWGSCGFARAQGLSIRPLIGGLTADAGLALGAEVHRSRLVGPVDLRLRALGSIKKYEFYEVGFEVPQLGAEWLSLRIFGRYRNFPQEDYYGLGPNTPKDQRTNYLLEDVDAGPEIGLTFGAIRAAVSFGVLRGHIGPGRDEALPTVPQELRSPVRYRHIGAALAYDTLDERNDPRSGGSYDVRWTRFLSDFQRFEFEVRRFVPLLTSDRLAFRLRTIFTDLATGRTAPFHMLPTVGGSRTVRGFSHYRFRDKNSLVLNAEYRRPLVSIADLVVFADAGRVFPRTADLGLTNLHSAAGAGTRLKFGKSVFVGIDLGFSREGTKLWLRSDHTF